MNSFVVLDTDFLSSFLKIRRLTLVRDFYGVDDLCIPSAVYQEISATDLVTTLPGIPWLDVKSLPKNRVSQLLPATNLESLGLGEIEAIALALDKGSDAVLLTNDNQARQQASALGIEVVNIPAFLLACKQTEFLGQEKVADIVVDLEREDHYGFRRDVRRALVSDDFS